MMNPTLRREVEKMGGEINEKTIQLYRLISMVNAICRGCQEPPRYPDSEKTLLQRNERATLLFAIEAALPFVESAVGERPCSSAGGPVALRQILKDYNWAEERKNFQ